MMMEGDLIKYYCWMVASGDQCIFLTNYTFHFFQVGGPTGSVMLDCVGSKLILFWTDFGHFVCVM
jgi:hypothetical protein